MEVEELEDQVKFLKKELIEMATRNIELSSKIKQLKEELDKNNKTVDSELQYTCPYCNKTISLHIALYRHSSSNACTQQRLVNILNHNSIYFKPT
jgi:transposase-like protein